jgi:hypothetical protein
MLVAITEFIAMVRQENEPQPVPIMIVNAREVGATEKILSVKRDDSGKMTGAALMPIN